MRHLEGRAQDLLIPKCNVVTTDRLVFLHMFLPVAVFNWPPDIDEFRRRYAQYAEAAERLPGRTPPTLDCVESSLKFPDRIDCK